ncbi:hypothetical protein [Lacrimispora sp.]|uniref:hypothetical protein n=1 Tax=Lacrimispora sp. TaxID=2719234 RepID=UPI0028ACFE29|nr:hypothetical protein [Lacrimispora sp.]
MRKVRKGLLILGTCLLLSGCSTTSPQKETTPVSTTASVAEMNSNDGTEDLPKVDILKKKLSVALTQIGVSEISDMSYDNMKKIDSETIFIDAIIETELYSLKCSCSYRGITGSWTVLYIDNSKNQHTYYTLPGTEDTVDLYDYANDTLVSKKTEDLKDKDPVKDFNEKLESMNEKQDAALDSISDEYNKK